MKVFSFKDSFRKDLIATVKQDMPGARRINPEFIATILDSTSPNPPEGIKKLLELRQDGNGTLSLLGIIIIELETFFGCKTTELDFHTVLEIIKQEQLSKTSKPSVGDMYMLSAWTLVGVADTLENGANQGYPIPHMTNILRPAVISLMKLFSRMASHDGYVNETVLTGLIRTRNAFNASLYNLDVQIAAGSIRQEDVDVGLSRMLCILIELTIELARFKKALE